MFREILFHRPERLFIFPILTLLLAFVFESTLQLKSYTRDDLKHFQKVLQQKEAGLEKHLKLLHGIAKDSSGHINFFRSVPDYFLKLYQNEGYVFAIYHYDSLVYWTENSVTMPELHEHFPSARLVNLGNSYFIKKEKIEGSYHIEGMIFIRTTYPYENRYLENRFHKDFSLTEDIEISVTRPEGKFPVYSTDGNYLFNLEFEKVLRPIEGKMIFGVILYGLFFLSLLAFLRSLVRNTTKERRVWYYMLSTLLLIGIYVLINTFRVPELLFRFELFSPAKFAQSLLLPSLGDLLLLSIMLFFLIYILHTDFSFRQLKIRKNTFNLLAFAVSALILVFGIYFINAFVFKSIILDSSISFEPYKVLDLSVYTFIGYMVLALLYAGFCLFADKIFMILEFNRLNKPAIVLLSAMVLFIFSGLLINTERGGSPESSLFYGLTIFVLWLTRFVYKLRYRFSTFVMYVLLFSAFTVYEVMRYSGEKSTSEMKMLAASLSAEHDPVAELLFADISPQLQNDPDIPELLNDPDFSFDIFYNTIRRRYFSGFWDKYDLQLTLCRPTDSVYVSPPEGTWYHCYNFFYEYVFSDGIKVPDSEFYYLENLNGRISYFGGFQYFTQAEDEVTLFLELDSRPVSEGLGYPELLLEERFSVNTREFSYAKYNRGQLITSSGPFSYSTSTEGLALDEGFTSLRFDRYYHIAYNIDGTNIILVSRPLIHWVDLLISFSYTFSFYFIVLILLLWISQISPIGLNFLWNFKNKIQFAMTAMLSVSLLLIGAGIVYFSIQQYRNRQTEILKEKIQSVYVELIHKLEFETDLHQWSSDAYYSLDALLQKFSNVFYTDINLYDQEGHLLASSRGEIFENGLLSTRMNPMAFNEMNQNNRSEFIHRESIGKLNYLSAYVPFVNSENQLLAYLNLPYFTRQYELTREVTNLVVAIINIMVLLSLLSFTIAVVLANRITYPLRLLQENMARVSLGGNNIKIDYRGRDEIGVLVNAYNQMVDELRESAEKLARSERESAWREMARQIAHEIKNPLTPMRLGLQHLQRISKSRPGDLEEMVDKLSEMLVEQIDHLSSIATEFSNFAKMPPAKIEKIELVGKLKKLLGLFSEYEGFEFFIEHNQLREVYIQFDREQLNRVFINLIKNAIQSVPDDRPGRIECNIELKDDMALVSIRDNGKGVPEEIRDKMFQPNFTTKSSGMGLGLAIVKNILENSGGRVYYETNPGEGSIFHVELPLYAELKIQAK